MAFTATRAQGKLRPLKIAANHRFFTTGNEQPFFWLGDTGWLLFSKLKREEAITYLDDRKQKGFNVIQVMVLHSLGVVNAYGDTALTDKNVARPKVTAGADFNDAAQYDYWDHVDYIIDQAAQRGMYIAMVPVWGSNVKDGGVTAAQATEYAAFLAGRFKDKTNILWLDGGDIKGSDSIAVWHALGATLKEKDKNHLVTFHPRGRGQSSMWFHNEPWLDFNMIQSGHKDYAQDTSAGDLHYGEDNWRYIQSDYALKPTKPVLDGEPIYEGIPHGLHDTTAAYWDARDLRRYGYWSVFAGGCGYTYGDNAVMQFYHKGDKHPSFGPREYWETGLAAPGSSQMEFLKKLILSKPYMERVPDESLIANQGAKYDYLAATRGKDYAFVYTCNGRTINISMGKIDGESVKASWYNPQDGKTMVVGVFANKGTKEFDPPGKEEYGNDWVLVLEKI